MIDILRTCLVFCLYGVSIAYAINVSEMNLLYQFVELKLDQFVYQDLNNFEYLTRLDNNIGVMNKMTKADLICFLEWNGNSKNPYYIADVKTLKKIFVNDYLAFGLQKILLGPVNLDAYAKKMRDEMFNDKDKKVDWDESFIPLDIRKINDEFRATIIDGLENNDGRSEVIQFAEKLIKNDQKITETVLNTLLKEISIKFNQIEKEYEKFKPYLLTGDTFSENVAISVKKYLLPTFDKGLDYDELIAAIKPQLLEGNPDYVDPDLQDFKVRYEIIQRIPKIDILTNPRFTMTVMRKKFGVGMLDGNKVVETVKEKPVKSALAPTQSVFFAYDKTKYRDYFRNDKFHANFIFGPVKKDKLQGQNFLVKFLVLKENCPQNPEKFEQCKKVVTISTHFKAKAEGFKDRKLIANEIYHFVTKLRGGKFQPTDTTDIFKDFEGHVKKDQLDHFKDSTILLLGDLNSEIDEVAQHLHSQIIRLESQFNLDSNEIIKPKSDGYKIAKIHKTHVAPEKEDTTLPEILDAKLKLTEELLKEKPFSELNKLKMVFKYNNLNSQKVTTDSNTKPNEESKEANNFPTERKMRLKEINFTGKVYNELLAFMWGIYQDKKNKNKDGKFDCFSFLNPKEKIYHSVPKRTVEDTKPDKRSVIKDRFERVGMYLRTLKCFQAYVRVHPNDEEIKKIYQVFYSSQFEIEKIDFILINSNEGVKVTKVESVDNYAKHFKFGIPNPGYGSDHFPTKVTIQIGGNKLDLNNIKQDTTLAPDWIAKNGEELLLLEIPEDFYEYKAPEQPTPNNQRNPNNQISDPNNLLQINGKKLKLQRRGKPLKKMNII